MSQENVELVRWIYVEGLFDRDPERLLAEFATRDVEDQENPPEAVEPGIRRGRAEFAQAAGQNDELFDSSRHELRELFDCGDRVVAAVSFHARSRGSETEVVQEEAHTWAFRAGKVISFEWSSATFRLR